MDDFHGKLYSLTPKNISRYLDTQRAPYIAIDIKKKKQKLNESPFNPNLISISSQVHSLRKQNFPSPKKLKKKQKRPDDLSLDFPINEILSLSPTPKGKINFPEYEEADKSLSPDMWKNSPVANMNKIKLERLEGNESILERIQMPSGIFPVSFKVKKHRKASNSVSSTMAYEKLVIPAVEFGKIESILKTSTPTPEVKVAQYVRHESFKAGYFLNKIDQMLNRIRVNRSRSSLNKNNHARNNLKSLIY